MRGALRLIAMAFLLQAGPAWAEQVEFEPVAPLDLDSVDPAMAADMFGRWTISDEAGAKSCDVELLKETTIGGMQIMVDPACESVFPVMADITAWRLLEGWSIDLVDAERKTRIRFSTPDERYAAFPEVDGIFTIAPRQPN
jgi:hypothetical protein